MKHYCQFPRGYDRTGSTYSHCAKTTQKGFCNVHLQSSLLRQIDAAICAVIVEHIKADGMVTSPDGLRKNLRRAVFSALRYDPDIGTMFASLEKTNESVVISHD